MELITKNCLNQTLEDAVLCKNVVDPTSWLWKALMISLVTKQTEVQTLIFDKKNFNRAQAVKWAKDHDFHSNKVDETSSSYRLRQRNPGDFVAGSFRIISITTGVKAVIGRPKKSKGRKTNGKKGGKPKKS